MFDVKRTLEEAQGALKISDFHLPSIRLNVTLMGQTYVFARTGYLEVRLQPGRHSLSEALASLSRF